MIRSPSPQASVNAAVAAARTCPKTCSRNTLPLNASPIGMRYCYDDTKTAVVVPLSRALLMLIVLTLHTALCTDYFLLIIQTV
jgi:hypothetical protein